MKDILESFINKISVLDKDISLKVCDDYIIIHKEYDRDNFLQKGIDKNEVYRWISLFGLEMTCKDILKTLEEDIRECYED